MCNFLCAMFLAMFAAFVSMFVVLVIAVFSGTASQTCESRESTVRHMCREGCDLEWGGGIKIIPSSPDGFLTRKAPVGILYHLKS